MPVGSQNAADPTLSKTAFTSAEAKTIHELRIVAAINLLEGRGIIAQMEHRRNEVEMTDEVEFNLRVTIPDRVSVDMAGYISSELGEIAMQYKQDWEEPEMVERPTRGEMAFLDEKSGLNFVVEQEYDAYVLKTTCIICGQVFSESLTLYALPGKFLREVLHHLPVWKLSLHLFIGGLIHLARPIYRFVNLLVFCSYFLCLP